MNVGNDHWLVTQESGLPAVLKVPSSRTTDLAVELGGPAGIVWHWTGGPARGPAFATALAGEIRTFNPSRDRAASWHVLVAKDGRLLQSIPFNRGSWHVGRPGRIAGKLHANINRATVGVELENSGRLEQVGGKFYCWPFWLNPDHHDTGPDPKLEIPAERAELCGGVHFDAFPLAQEVAAARLMSALVLKYKITREDCQYGHRDFDPVRKEDPGALWQEVVLQRVLKRVFG
jgi:N-acetyl-anhydromuramyl-L-alanine amidase AmpD